MLYGVYAVKQTSSQKSIARPHVDASSHLTWLDSCGSLRLKDALPWCFQHVVSVDCSTRSAIPADLIGAVAVTVSVSGHR